MKKKKVFLGGNCNESMWRAKLINMLEIDYFNPVVDDWTEECMAEEERQKEICDYCLYVITPKMTGVFAIAEAVDDSNKQPEKTVFCVLLKDDYEFFTLGQTKSLQKVEDIIRQNGGVCLPSLTDIANFLNSTSNKEIEQ